MNQNSDCNDMTRINSEMLTNLVRFELSTQKLTIMNVVVMYLEFF